MRFDKILLLNMSLLFIMSNFLQGCTLKDELTGFLLVPMRLNLNDNVAIFSIDLKNGEKLKEYFASENYTDICSPIKVNQSLFCAAKKIKDDCYVVLEVNKSNISEIFRTDTKIISFDLKQNKFIVFIKEINKKAYLFSYNFNNGSITKIYDGEIDIESKPIICKDDSIIFVAAKDNAFIVNRLYRDGKIEQLVNGRYPLLIDKETGLIYYTSRSIFWYDMMKHKERRIKKNINLLETPTLSSDEKYISFYESDYVASFGGERTDFLSVLSLKSHDKRHINVYNRARGKLRLSGVFWTDSLD